MVRPLATEKDPLRSEEAIKDITVGELMTLKVKLRKTQKLAHIKKGLNDPLDSIRNH